jgi:hypothetical protein
MTFAQNMAGLCATACLVEIALLRIPHSRFLIWRRVLTAAVVSGTIWCVAWIVVKQVMWSPKLMPLEEYSVRDWMMAILAHGFALLMWSSIAFVPSLITALLYRRFMR